MILLQIIKKREEGKIKIKEKKMKEMKGIKEMKSLIYVKNVSRRKKKILKKRSNY